MSLKQFNWIRTLLILFCSFSVYGNASEREEKRVYNAITTIPKAGTNYFIQLMGELKIGIPVTHYFLETDEYKADFGYAIPDWLMHKPDDFVGKTALVIRDLHDIMSSTVFWLDKIFTDILQAPSDAYDAKTLEEMQQFLCEPFDIKLLKVIALDGICRGQMLQTRSAAELIVELLKKPSDSIFVVRFEDYIGIEAGGSLTDTERFKLLSDLCYFLEYPRSTTEVERAVQKIFGKGHTYNPVKTKVGRWRESFDERHIEAFQKHWENLNQAIGYETI